MTAITIGLTGPAGVGKDTVGLFMSSIHEYDVFSFAKPLKDGLSIMFNIPREDFDDRALKEVNHVQWGLSPRAFAQTCGTEFARNFVGADVWIRRLAFDEEFMRSPRRVITDVRFDNEADWVRSQGGVIWHLSRSGVQSVRSHVSEAGVRFRDGDVHFVNDGDFDDCKEVCCKALVLSGGC